MVYEIIPIKLGSIIPYPKQPGTFFALIIFFGEVCFRSKHPFFAEIAAPRYELRTTFDLRFVAVKHEIPQSPFKVH